jgi:ferredoxin
MATITFSPQPRGKPVTIEARAEVGRRLLSVAREHGIGVLFTCSAGACGACLVEVADLSGAQQALAPPGEEEALLLRALGKLPPAGGAIAAGASTAFRLACQYIVTDADIVVRYPSDLGSV